MTAVIARIVRSDGLEFVIGDGDWRIPNDGLENWANLSYNVSSTELPAEDGAVITSKRVASIDRTITAECRGSEPDLLRAKAIEFFNPEYTFEVHLTYRGRTRWCEGEQIGFKASEGNIYKRPTIAWTILCPNPYLKDEDGLSDDIAETVPMMGFPWVSAYPNQLTNKYAVASAHTFQRIIDIENNGDVPSAMRVTIKAKGLVRNPFVKIGESLVKLNTDMEYGDIAEFDMTTKPPRVRLNGNNAIHLLDINSSILNLQLEPGTTTIEYDADYGNALMSVTVYWYPQYLGI